MKRWPLVPVILFVAQGLISDARDQPPVVVLALPLILLLSQFIYPTVLGWRVAFGSFCLFIVSVLAIDLPGVVRDGLPSTLASLSMVGLFIAIFGGALGLLWLARPRSTDQRAHVHRSLSKLRVLASTKLRSGNRSQASRLSVHLVTAQQTEEG